jgi:hypothetical protein
MIYHDQSAVLRIRDVCPVPEFIDPVFAKTSPKCSFSLIENERFGLVFAKTGTSGTDPDFTHLGSKNSNKRDGWKKIGCHTFLVATNFTKLLIVLFLKC